MSANTRELLVCAAALLEQGRTLDRLSQMLTAAALIILVFARFVATNVSTASIGLAIAVAVAGLVETYFSIRVGFDAALFRHVAMDESTDFSRTDAALMELSLLPAAKAGRPVHARVAGARRLFVLQSIVVIAQVACMVAGAWLQLAGR